MSRAESPRGTRLRDFLRGVGSRKRLIVLVVLLAVLPASVISLLQTPLYAGHADVLLGRGADGSGNPASDASRRIQSEISILESRPVRTLVEQRVLSPGEVTGAPIAGTEIIRVTAKNTDPRQAAIIANTYATTYIEYRRQQAVDDLLAVGQQVQARIADLERRAAQAPAGPEKSTLDRALSTLRQESEQLQAAGARTQGGPQLVAEAAIPSEPVAPKPLRTTAIALAIGLALGLAIALVAELFNDSVKSKAHFEEVAGGVPVVGLIPLVAEWRTKENPRLVSLSQPTSPAAEAYRTLRTMVQSRAVDHPMRTLQVTSCNAGEGKTTTVANLGIAFARSGHRVVVACCDLRRPRLHEFFGLSNEIGFTSVLLGKVPLTGALQEVADQPRLHVLASGPLPSNPAELLSSKRTTEVLGTLQMGADMVLLDSPPVLPVTDALVLSSRVDATLLVCALRATERREVVRSVELLNEVGASLVGAVLNGVSQESSDAYGYGYYRKGASSTAGQRSRPTEPVRSAATVRAGNDAARRSG